MTPQIVLPQPGIQRDGTQLSAESWTDGQWARFKNGKPQKIGGYRDVSQSLDGVARGLHAYARGGQRIIHVGTSTSISRVLVDGNGLASTPTARTSPITPTPKTLWQMDARVNPIIGNQPYIMAHAGENLDDIDSSVTSPVVWGDMTANTALTALATAPQVSGGVIVLHPYTFVFGSDGFIAHSGPNQPETWVGPQTNSGYFTGQKIVCASPTRGGVQSPAGLFWSLDSVVRATYRGGTTEFAFDHVSASSSILSSRCVAEYDGIHFWPGVDRFLTYNGGVREIINTYSTDWFFKNVNMRARQKVFSFVNARWGEIWWCFPFGDATECTHALIYNVRENIWYDTELRNQARSSALSSSVLGYPVMGGAEINSDGLYDLWRHEIGTDAVRGNKLAPIRSFIQTSDITFLKAGEPANNAVAIIGLEPDFVQSGDLKVTPIGNANARSPDRIGETSVFPAPPAEVGAQKVALKAANRRQRLIFESDAVGGHFEYGTVIAQIDASAERASS